MSTTATAVAVPAGISNSGISNVGNLQASIRSLVNERREIRDRLNRNQGRNQANDGKERRIKRDRTELEGSQVEDGLGKRFQTAPPSSVTKPSSVSMVDVQLTAFPVEKRPSLQVDDNTVKRNRNLFGSLLGHLKKAKTVLEQEKNTKAAELHRTMEEQVSQKLDFERKNLAELRRRDFQERQRKDLARIREVQAELRIKENEMLSLCLQQHFNRMKSFIRTDTAPLIFWIPSLHNEKTKKLQDDTREQIDRKLKSIVEKFATENNKVRTSLLNSLNSLDDNEGVGMENSEHDNNKLDVTTAAAASAAAGTPLEAIRGIHPDLIDDSDDSDGSDHDVNDEQMQDQQQPPTMENHQSGKTTTRKPRHAPQLQSEQAFSPSSREAPADEAVLSNSGERSSNSGR